MRFLTAVLVLSLAAGCGSGAPDDAPPVAPVRGKVTRKGAPLAKALVVYSPKTGADGTGSSSSAVTNDQGEYELIYNRNLNGAMIGKHAVRVTLGDGIDDNDESKKDPNEIVIPAAVGVREVEVPAEGLEGGAADIDLDF